MIEIMFLNNSNCKDSDERMTLCEKGINSNDEIIMKQIYYFNETQFLQ